MLLPGFSLAGYRSFGPNLQRFERLAKLNLFIGPNNCGKSNVLRFIHSVYPRIGQREGLRLGPLDRHFPNSTEFRCGLRISLELDKDQQAYTAFNEFVLPLLKEGHQSVVGNALRVFQRKAELDGTSDVWFDFREGGELIADNWQTAFAVLSDKDIYSLWNALVHRTGGSRQQHWFPESLRRLTPQWVPARAEMIPAIRRIGSKGSESEEFGGEGIIERLARLQNPDVHRQADKERFAQINRFLQWVTDNNSAELEVPYARDTINVHMDGKALPLESLGTGIHEVIILAVAATLLEDTVVCMEEPELHLNPILQKKLVRYLISKTSNQYFITTHSAALMDTPGAETYHIQLQNGQSLVDRVTSDRRRSIVCEDLGYHPSDLLQANCIVWVEGPSDRLYLNYWIRNRAADVQEGIHYSIMFYGGRLASHLTGHDLDEAVKDFISLLRLNRRTTIVIDSDRTSGSEQLNATKQRLVEEFSKGPGHAWVTEGREIENYLQPEYVKKAMNAVVPNAEPRLRMSPYDKVLEIKRDQRVTQAPKVEIAKHVTTNFEPDESRLDLRERLDALMAFIRASNPRGLHVGA